MSLYDMLSLALNLSVKYNPQETANLCWRLISVALEISGYIIILCLLYMCTTRAWRGVFYEHSGIFKALQYGVNDEFTHIGWHIEDCSQNTE